MADNEHDKEKNQGEAPKKDDKMPASVDSILQERLRLEQEQAALDQMLKEKFQKNITVMFTDIKGSTSYFETYGDVEGRAMVERHNAMLFPKVKQFGGRVIKTIGDAIMAVFDDPAQGVKAAIAMQKVLEEYNKAQDQKHRRILVRIGLNHGPAVVEEKDVFGDAVNVAARVESKCDAEQILISDSLYKEVRGDDEILVRFFGDVECKGKAEPVKIYRVVWSDTQMVAEGEFKKAATRRTVDKRGKVVRGRVIELDASRDGNKLKISVFERQRGEERTVSQYDVVKLDEKLVREQCDEVVNLLNRANTRGKVTKEILKQMQGVGQILFDHLLSQEAKEKIANSQAEHLVIKMDDRLVHVPWELLFDGKQFFCQRFGMGRIVATRQRIADVPDREIAKPLRMLVVADPRSDLPASRDEGSNIRNELDGEHEFINVNLKSSEVPTNFLKAKIRDYDLIHYAGHADYDSDNPENSGWLLADGKLSAADVKNMTGKKPMPSLVFANACQSGQTDEWKLEAGYEKDIFGVANAFLVSGVQHYIGTFWDILDDPGHDFAIAFYKEVIKGASVGESARRARLALIDKYGEDTIVWASYMVYGDPTFSYLEDVAAADETTQDMEAPAPPKADAAPLTQPGQPVVTRGASTMAAPAQDQGLSKATLGVAVAILAVLLAIGGYVLFGGGKDHSKLLASAGMKLQQGDYPGALADYGKLSEIPETRMQGMQGLALTYNRMGLDASQRGDKDAAMKAYEAGLKADPNNSELAINAGQSFLAMGNVAQAQEVFEKALKSDPESTVALAMLAQINNTMAMQADSEKQAELQSLTKDLAERFRTGNVPPPKNADDEWTSRAMTMTFLDFDRKGKSMLMEGEEEFLKIALTQALRDSGRVEVVEREKIDLILRELNLSSTELANDDTRLRLGKLFGARLIATGSYIRSGEETQVNLRLIETETTIAKVAISEVIQGKQSPGDLAKAIASSLITQIESEYPVQGKITEVSKDKTEIKINVGKKAGAAKGMKLDILDADEIEIGKIEITGAGPDVSKATVLQAPEKMAAGMKVKEAAE